VRCPYCGNENPGDHRFCGMCGRPLVEVRANAPVSTQPAAHHEPEPSPPAPAYTGGLFNLGAPADKPHRSLDYLLEDDEEPKSNKGLIFLCLIALVLVGGMGWLRWRNGTLPSFKFPTHEPTTTTASPPKSPDGSGNSSATEPQDQAPQPALPGAVQASPSAEKPDTTGSTSSAPPSSNSPFPSASSASPPNTDAPSGDPDVKAAAAAPANAPGKPANDKPSEIAEASPPPVAPPAKPKALSKPAPKPAPKASDQVTLGEQYLYGRGVPQSCERGLRYVKPAADQSNPKAMITMGALYATGHCLSRDLPTAYRFFALALRSDPENGPLRQNAEMVWKQMTSEERKQAIRLTQ
jgi:hypothetical protein